MENIMKNYWEDFLYDFKNVDFSNYPEFRSIDKPFEMGLWVLWIAKDELKVKKLTADQIASIIRDVMEVSISSRAIVNSFNKSKGGKIHQHKEKERISYEIMKSGKNFLISKNDKVKVLYFEPNRKYKSKRVLSGEIFNLKGELRIIDPYCDKKTLDVLENTGKTKIKFLTKIDNIRDQRKKRSFLRELQDFKSDYPNIEFRDYPQNDIHDRYIISNDAFVIIGYSIKDFGKKETFVTIFRNNQDILLQLDNNFEYKWNMSTIL